jgi:hypothetical protein
MRSVHGRSKAAALEGHRQGAGLAGRHGGPKKIHEAKPRRDSGPFEGGEGGAGGGDSRKLLRGRPLLCVGAWAWGAPGPFFGWLAACSAVVD